MNTDRAAPVLDPATERRLGRFGLSPDGSDWTERYLLCEERPAQEAGVKPPRLHVIHSRFRNLVRPIRHFVEHIEKEHPDRQVAVIILELVKSSWWHYLLHNRRAAQLRGALLALGHPRIAVVSVPWRMHYLHDDHHHRRAAGTPAAT